MANITMYVGARTQSSPSLNYIDFILQIVDCREQKISIINPSYPIAIGLTANSTSLFEKELYQKFESSHPVFCPLTSMVIKKVLDNSDKQVVGYDSFLYLGPLNNTSGSIFVSKTDELINNYKIWVQVSTGYVTTQYSDDLTSYLLTLSIVEGPNFTPYFETAPDNYLMIDLNKENSGTILLSTITDDNLDVVYFSPIISEKDSEAGPQKAKSLQKKLSQLESDDGPVLLFSDVIDEDQGKYELHLILTDEHDKENVYKMLVEITRVKVFEGVTMEPVESEEDKAKRLKMEQQKLNELRKR